MKKLVLTAAVMATFSIAGVAAAQDVASYGAPLQGLPNFDVAIPGAFSIVVKPEKYAKFSINEVLPQYTDRNVAIMQPWAADSQAVEFNDWTLKTNTPITLSLRSNGFWNPKSGEDASIMDNAIRYSVSAVGSEVYNKDTYALAPTPVGSASHMDPNGTWTLDTGNSFGEVNGIFDAWFSPDKYVYGFGDSNNAKGNEWTDILAGTPVVDIISVLVTE